MLDRIDAEVREIGAVTLDTIGGERELWRHQDELVGSPLLPYVVDLVCREWEQLSRTDAVAFASAAVRNAESPLAFADATDRLLACEPILEALGDELAEILLTRGAASGGDGAEIATRALEGALRLVLGGWSQRRFELLAALVQPRGELSPFADARLCRLIGIGDEHWPALELVHSLERFVEEGVAAGDASFELGLAELRRALAHEEVEAALTGLERARRHFDAAAAITEERSDAGVYALAVDAVVGFVRQRSADWLTATAKKLRELLVGRLLWRPVREGSWLEPRIEAELEWQRLAELLASAAARTETADRWLQPPLVLAQLVETYSASRSVRLFAWRPELGAGVDRVIEPRIENAFLAERWRAELLRRWLETTDEIDDEHRVAAVRLLDALEAGEGKKGRRPRRFRPRS